MSVRWIRTPVPRPIRLDLRNIIDGGIALLIVIAQIVAGSRSMRLRNTSTAACSGSTWVEEPTLSRFIARQTPFQGVREAIFFFCGVHDNKALV